MKIYRLICSFICLSACILSAEVQAQEGSNHASGLTSVVKPFNIRIVSDYNDSERDYPKRSPGNNPSELLGVYNDSLQTLTLTFNFTSEDACVTIYRNFNKMYTETIDVVSGDTAVYDLSGYGDGYYVVDVRHESDDAYVYFGDFSNIESVPVTLSPSPWPGPYYKSGRRVSRQTSSSDAPQYSYDAMLDIAPVKTFSSTVSYDNTLATISVKSEDTNANVYFFDEEDPSRLSVSFTVTKGLANYTTMQYPIIANRPYKLLVTAPVGSGTSGKCSIITGSYTFTNKTITDIFYSLPLNVNLNSTNNIFCTSRSEDLQLYVMNGSGIGTVAAFNDNYGNAGDFNWGNWPRVKAVFPNSVTGVMVNNLSYRMPNVWAFCNLYVGCATDSTIFNRLYPNNSLSFENAMVSAPQSRNYNQFSWITGRHDIAEHPASVYSVYNNNRSYGLDAMDDILGRFGYTRTTESDPDCGIDIYGTIDSTENDTLVKFASVRAYHGPSAAGYAWESKFETKERLFHPRHWAASLYGQYLGSYRMKSLADLAQSNEFESIMMDYVLENAELTSSEISQIYARLVPVSYDDTSDFYWYFDNASADYEEAESDDFSQIAENEYYQELLALCMSKPLLMNLAYLEVNDGNLVAIKLLEDMITQDQQTAYNNMLTRKASIAYTQNAPTPEKKKIYRTIQDNAVLFIKDLLSDNQMQQAPQGVTYSDDQSAFSVKVEGRTIEIGFELDEPGKVSLCVINQNGTSVSQVYNRQQLQQGSHTSTVTIPQPGTYFVSYIINGRVYDRKLNIY